LQEIANICYEIFLQVAVIICQSPETGIPFVFKTTKRNKLTVDLLQMIQEILSKLTYWVNYTTNVRIKISGSHDGEYEDDYLLECCTA
jgi:hypothetical protein